MTKYTVVFITPALSGGGIEKSTSLLLKGLLTRFPHNLLWIGMNKSVNDDTLIARFSFSLGRNSRDGVMATLRTVFQARNLIINQARPVAVINGELAEVVALTLPRRVPIVCVEHASRPWKNSRKIGFIVRQLLKHRAAHWISVNSDQNQIWPNIKRFTYVPNPIQRIDPKESDQEIGLVHIGRLTKEKGIELVCSVSMRTHLPLDVYGDGPLLDGLKDLYRNEDKLKLHGFQSEPWSEIGPAKLLISASLHEGDGRVIAEAIVRRQPIALLDTPDHRKFRLPDSQYFRDLDSLEWLININLDSGFMGLRPPSEISEYTSNQRSLSRITSTYMEIFDQVEHGRMST